MTDPFNGLNINNLQTFNATNSRLQQMNQSMSKPLMSSHLPQLPQQQMKATVVSNRRPESAEEECDERKRFERSRKFQLQQKRLQEMSFSRPQTNTNSAADQLMANLIQRVETEAKLDKRIHLSQRTASHNYSPAINPLMASHMASVSGQTSNPSYLTQYSNLGQNMSTLSTTTQQNNNYFNGFNPQNVCQTSYPQNQTLKTTPILQQIFTNTGADHHNSRTCVQPFNGHNRPESGVSYTNNYLPQTTANQTINTNNNFNSNFDTIFSISANNSVNGQPIPTEPTPSAARLQIPRKLPNCFEDMSKLPALYMKVWNFVRISELSNICDTNKLYAVLLSVGLPQPVLAQLWTVVNHTIPGQLTQSELFMALALIALKQKNSINPLEEVYKLDSLPVPSIQFFSESIETSSQRQTQQPTEQTLSNCEQSDGLSLYLTKNEQNFCNFTPNPDNCLTEDTNDEDFDDFKSADFSSIASTDSHSMSDSLQKQTTDTESAVNIVAEDDFDDFKSALNAETNQSFASFGANITENPLKPKPIQLSDALMSNMSAFSSSNSHQNPNPMPVLSISSVNSGQNHSEFISNPEPMTTIDPNSSLGDKYSAFRVLLTENQTKDSDFGNFLSHTTNCDVQSVDSLQFGHQDSSDYDTIESISYHLIQTSRHLIHKAFNVLVVSHGADSVLEAIRAKEGNGFAFDLSEIYAIVQRVVRNLKSKDKLNDNLMKLIEDIDSTWNTINSVFTKASIDIDLKDGTEAKVPNTLSECAICCSKATTDRPVLTFAGHEYHTSCANLWLNCINPTLPQPLVNCR